MSTTYILKVISELEERIEYFDYQMELACRSGNTKRAKEMEEHKKITEQSLNVIVKEMNNYGL